MYFRFPCSKDTETSLGTLGAFGESGSMSFQHEANKDTREISMGFLQSIASFSGLGNRRICRFPQH